MYDPIRGKVIISRNVIFDEESKWSWSQDSKVQSKIPFEEGPSNEVPAPMSGDSNSNQNGNGTTSTSSSGSKSSPSPESSFEVTPPLKVRSLREIYESCTFALVVSNPTT